MDAPQNKENDDEFERDDDEGPMIREQLEEQSSNSVANLEHSVATSDTKQSM